MQRDIETPCLKWQFVILLAYVPYCWCVHVWQRVVQVVHKQTEKNMQVSRPEASEEEISINGCGKRSQIIQCLLHR
jgi:hypothetical protein